MINFSTFSRSALLSHFSSNFFRSILFQLRLSWTPVQLHLLLLAEASASAAFAAGNVSTYVNVQYSRLLFILLPLLLLLPNYCWLFAILASVSCSICSALCVVCLLCVCFPFFLYSICPFFFAFFWFCPPPATSIVLQFVLPHLLALFACRFFILSFTALAHNFPPEEISYMRNTRDRWSRDLQPVGCQLLCTLLTLAGYYPASYHTR